MRLTLSYDTSSNISWICVGFSTWVETGWEELRESTSMASKHFPKKKSSWEKEGLFTVNCIVKIIHKYCGLWLFLYVIWVIQLKYSTYTTLYVISYTIKAFWGRNRWRVWRNKRYTVWQLWVLVHRLDTSQFPELSSHHMQLWVGDVERNILHELGKTLIEPQVVPPLHRHQVPEPLHRRTVFESSKRHSGCDRSAATTQADV